MPALRTLAVSAWILSIGATGAVAQDLPFPLNLFAGPQATQARPAPSADIAMAVPPTRTLVDDPTGTPKGWITIDTKTRYLYLALGDGKALRYGIGVGREGFGWSGHVHIARRAEWPDWTPPAVMLKRRPDLPRYMTGGIDNPLGARALYLFNARGDTGFRIHGTNEPDTIGQAVSSGCIRMLNIDVEDLYTRVRIGTQVNVI
jgi:lipoprotein-anchoring transpeptidase ErfK/SrfK